MTTNKTKALLAAALAAALGVGAYWWWSPYVTLNSMRSAVQARDGAKLSDHIDFPKLRESFKGQFAAHMAKEAGKDDLPGAALGMGLAMTVVPSLIDAMVRPEMLMKMLADQSAADAAASTPKRGAAPQWDVRREGADRVLVVLGSDKAGGLVLERSGFATWKVSAVRMEK